MSNLEQRLHSANRRYINIADDRCLYTEHYNELRNRFYSELKKIPPLNTWLCGHQLGGSYVDKLKITKPDEFDLIIHLNLIDNAKIIVKKDPKFPGNVILNVASLLNYLKDQPKHMDSYKELSKIVSADNFLLEDKLQDMITGTCRRALNAMNNQIVVNGKPARIVYKRCGPAHTLIINEADIKYSVDFVPAIKLLAMQNILDPKKRLSFGRTEFWDAIPKPMKPFKPYNNSFRASYSVAEMSLLRDRNNLKNTIKFMKKFRDNRTNMNNLKSYYIKTLILWQVEKRDSTYWNGPLKSILIDMFRELKYCLATSGRPANLKFFWDENLNLFGSFTESQRVDMFRCVTSELYNLEREDGFLADDTDCTSLPTYCNRSNPPTRTFRQNGIEPDEVQSTCAIC